MYFIKIIQGKRAPEQALVKINEDQTLKDFITTYKGIENLNEVNHLDVFVGTCVNFEEMNLYKIDITFTLIEILRVYPSCSRILFKFKACDCIADDQHSAATEGNKENAFSKMMNNARSGIIFPKRDAKTTEGENKLWNLLVEKMKSLNCGFKTSEAHEMATFMNVLFSCLW